MPPDVPPKQCACLWQLYWVLYKINIGDMCNVPSIQDNQWVCVSITQNMMGGQLGYQEGLVLLLIRLIVLLNRS